MRLTNRPAGMRRLKSIESIVDRRSLLSGPMLRLTEWMADYYLCGWGQVLEAVVPSGVRGQAGTRQTQFVSLPNHVAARLTTLRLSPIQKRILEILAGAAAPIPIRRLADTAGCTAAPIRTLHKKGLVALEDGRADTGATAEPAPRDTEAHLTLNADQRQALDVILSALQSRLHETILVHGVTGSGKTEVYIQAIHEVVALRPASDRAGAGDQSHAANRTAASAPLRQRGACCTAT